MNSLASSVSAFLVTFAGVDTAVIALVLWPPNPQEKTGLRTHGLLIVIAVIVVTGISLVTGGR